MFSFLMGIWKISMGKQWFSPVWIPLSFKGAQLASFHNCNNSGWLVKLLRFLTFTELCNQWEVELWCSRFFSSIRCNPLVVFYFVRCWEALEPVPISWFQLSQGYVIPSIQLLSEGNPPSSAEEMTLLKYSVLQLPIATGHSRQESEWCLLGSVSCSIIVFWIFKC